MRISDWSSDVCSSDLIAADGTWFHQGTPIRRPEMVRLFSRIVRREADGGYVLVTPVEKLDILVEDAPFVAVAVESEGEGRDRRLEIGRASCRERVCQYV